VDDQQIPPANHDDRNLAIVILCIVVPPVAYLLATGYYVQVNFGQVIGSVLLHFAFENYIVNISVDFQKLAIAVAVIVVSSAFLFEVKLGEVTRKSLEQNRFGRRFLRIFTVRKKRLWHIVVGYFLIIATLQPILTDQIYGEDSFSSYVGKGSVVIPLIAIIMITTRLLSKIDFLIIGTNIGVFIVAIYTSSIFLEFFTPSFGTKPLDVLNSIFYDHPHPIEDALILWNMAILYAVVISLIDRYIVTHWLKKKEL
jgi:hypothetical protein